MAMFKLRTLPIIAFALVALPTTGVLADEIPDPAQVAAETCPTEWAALERVAPEEVLAYLQAYQQAGPNPIWEPDVAAAVGRLGLLSNVIMASIGALLAFASSAATDDTWQNALIEHDLEYEWTRGVVRSHLLTCLRVATEENRDLAIRAVIQNSPEMEEDVVRDQLEIYFQELDALRCQDEILQNMFALDFGQPDLAAGIRQILEADFQACFG